MQLAVVTSVEAWVEEFARMFEMEFTLMSILVGPWLLDSGATHHMIGAWELFDSLTDWDSKMHVEFGVDTKHVLKGVGTVTL